MDDLSGLDWSSSASSTSKPVTKGTGNYYPAIQHTPISSGRATPVSTQPSGVNRSILISKVGAPDSFSNLVSFGSTKQSNNLSLAEQQAKLQAEKAHKAQEQHKQYDAQFGNAQFWNGLGTENKQQPITNPAGSLASTTTFSTHPPSLSATLELSSPFSSNQIPPALDSPEEDLFAAFNKDARVDNSSHYPPPSITVSRKSTPLPSQGTRLDLNDPKAWETHSPRAAPQSSEEDDDDPFGLGRLAQRTTKPARHLQERATEDDDDDFLGDLGKPVEEVKKKSTVSILAHTEHMAGFVSNEGEYDPWDKAVDELVDMGFSAENARKALTESGSGLDIQAAVGWLLNDAHRQAKEKAFSKTGLERPSDRRTAPSSSASRADSAGHQRADAIPAWMRQDDRDRSQPRRADSRSPASVDGDLTKTAAGMGTNFLKTANSLWKTSQKRVQQAVSEFQQEPDTSQPKWMRAGAGEREGRSGRNGGEVPQQSQVQEATPSVTDEAMMLEADARPQIRPKKAAPHSINTASNSAASSRNHSPALSASSTGRSTPNPYWQSSKPVGMPSSTVTSARARLSKQVIAEESAQAYISPARRRKGTPISAQAEEPDLLSEASTKTLPASAHPSPPSVLVSSSRPIKLATTSAPIAVRPKAPPRDIPILSPSALAISNKHRLAGTDHFKRGDYASAHAAYTASLSPLPDKHPITIALLCNRSLTALKTGAPKQAVSDADSALILIGPSRGEEETIDLEGPKPMKAFWGKALTRKAEALEQMERWADARDVWKLAVEARVGGATAAQGRQRCEKALTPKAKPVVRALPKQKSTTSVLAPTKDSEAVVRMRAANAAAAKADDEKFALSDSVDARIKTWRDGKQDNLRALLGGMDQVLWEGSGWKRVGMHELVMNNKVKINYMKAIAKVHPDKLAQDASVEVQMISAAVFATLNEAWDKFKEANNI